MQFVGLLRCANNTNLLMVKMEMMRKQVGNSMDIPQYLTTMPVPARDFASGGLESVVTDTRQNWG